MMKNLKICYLAVMLTAFGCETTPMVEPMAKAQKQHSSLLLTGETAPFTYASRTYTLQPLALPHRTDVACNVSRCTPHHTDVACNVSRCTPHHTDVACNVSTATKFFIADATVVIDATTGAIDLAATMAQQPIPAGTSREATIQYLNNGTPGSLRVKIYRYRTVEEIPVELMKQLSDAASGRMEDTNPPKLRDVGPLIIIVSG